jgi:hypothetical protein
MRRRIWIISRTTEITPQVIAEAASNNCSEIAKGAPPALKNQLIGKKLPLAYEESEPIIPEEPRDILKELDELKAEVEALKAAKDGVLS